MKPKYGRRFRLPTLIFLASILHAQTGVIEGTVVDSTTHAGVPDVQVMVQRAGNRITAGQSATTDASGNFRIEGIAGEGAFDVGYGKPGFVPGGHSLHLTAGTPAHLLLELTPMPRMHGRVIDGEGNPVPDAVVQLVSIGGGGRPNTKTGKDGRFDFESMIPIAYVLKAIPPPKMEPPKSPQDEPRVWAPTFYPGVTEQFRAQPFRPAGADSAAERVIRLIAVPVFHIRGIAVDEDDQPIAGATITAISPDSLDARSHAAFEPAAGTAKTADDGTFDIAGIRPGEWFLIAAGKSGGKAVRAVTPGTVTRGDWQNVKLRLVAPFTVKGTVERPEGARRTGWVGLIPAWQTRILGIPDETGKLEIDEIVPGKYRVTLEEPPQGLYVDTVQFGGRDILGQTVDVMDAAQRLRVVYKSDGGRVQGSVEKCDRGTVVLLPAEPALQYSEMMHWGYCGRTGRFEIGGLRPGMYYAAAFNNLSDLGLYYGAVVDPALIARITERGVSVKVDAAQAANANLTVIDLPQ